MKKIKNIIQYIFIANIFFNLSPLLNAQDRHKPKPPETPNQKQYSIEQATSERAQLHTIAFNGLAFLTGSFGADCFFPPGKVADYFGFQYMRDIDKNEMGHNTDFLTRIANNFIHILNDNQLDQLKELANKQAPVYDEFANQRMILIKAFCNELEGQIPSGKKELSKENVIKFCAKIYELDAELSYNRALVVGHIINSFSELQKKDIAKLNFDNSSTWSDLPETIDKKSMTHRAHVCVMTYASELFSWYAGSVKADVYFCPERHGTYFGGFYLKDFPAMGNHNYKISTKLTGDKGNDFLNILSNEQGDCLKQIVQTQEPLLKEIIQLRTDISNELRKAMKNEIPDKEKIFSLIKRYGEIDGELSYNYAICFTKISKTLTSEQKKKLIELRDLKVLPKGVYLFSDPIDIPENINTGFLYR